MDEFNIEIVFALGALLAVLLVFSMSLNAWLSNKLRDMVSPEFSERANQALIEAVRVGTTKLVDHVSDDVKASPNTIDDFLLDGLVSQLEERGLIIRGQDGEGNPAVLPANTDISTTE